MNRPDYEIHASATIDPSARIGRGVVIGPKVVIGKDVSIDPYVVIKAGVTVGDSVKIHSFAVIGDDPQVSEFDRSIQSGVRIGDRTVIREAATIHRASQADSETIVGSDCLLMVNTHVGHDSIVGNSVICANNVMIGGHVTVGDFAFFGGGAGVHQHCRVGSHSMIAANAAITADVPPYVMAANRRDAHGLNLVGLKRHGFEQREISDLKRCYRAVFFGGGNLREKAAVAAREHEFGITAVGARFLSFFEKGSRGFIQSSLEKSKCSE